MVCQKSPEKLKGRDGPFFEIEEVPATKFMEWFLLQKRCDEIDTFIKTKITDVEGAVTLVEKNAGSLRYKLVGQSAGGGPKPLGELFGMFETHREKLHLADFQITQATLEQTFNRFAAGDLEKEADVGIEHDHLLQVGRQPRVCHLAYLHGRQ